MPVATQLAEVLLSSFSRAAVFPRNSLSWLQSIGVAQASWGEKWLQGAPQARLRPVAPPRVVLPRRPIPVLETGAIPARDRLRSATGPYPAPDSVIPRTR